MPDNAFLRLAFRPNLRRVFVLSAAACLLNAPHRILEAQQAKPSGSDPLASAFRNPPAAAHPRVWWHWMNGNITRDGITQDLDWMHRVGIAGFQNFDASLNTPKVVDHRLIYMQPDWQEAFRFAVSKGDSYGFEMTVAGSPGWSESGGPWVKPEQAMKKIVWSTTSVQGGKPVRIALAQPPRATGPISNLAQQNLMSIMGGGDAPKPVADFGADTVVLAVREPALARSMAQLQPMVTTSAGNPIATPSNVYDGDLNSYLSFPIKPGETGMPGLFCTS
jgi:hypothetical protein